MLFAAYRQSRWFHITIYLAASLVWSCFISFGHAHGFIQIIGLVVVERLVLGTLVVFRPGHSRASDALFLFLSIMRVSTVAALIPFVNDPIGLDPIPRVVVCSVGIVALLSNSLSTWRFGGQCSETRGKSSERRPRARWRNHDPP